MNNTDGRIIRNATADARISTLVANTAYIGLLFGFMALFAIVMWMNRPLLVQACHAPQGSPAVVSETLESPAWAMASTAVNRWN